MKLCFQGTAAMREMAHYCERSIWVGIGTFGLNFECDWMRFLPKANEIVVGLPREEEGRRIALRRLADFKRWKPELHLAVRYDFHAKYALFRTKRSQYVMIGSANCTHSPSIETVAFFEDKALFDSLVKRHSKWFLSCDHFVEPTPTTPRLSKAALGALSSLPVDAK